MLTFQIFYDIGDNEAFYICRICILLLFALINIELLIFLRTSRIASSNTTRLIKIQTILDILSIFSIVMLNFEETDLHALQNIHYRRFYCYFYTSGYIPWFISYCNTSGMVLMSFERFICILFPFHYKRITKKKTYLIICLTFIICLSILFSDLANLNIHFIEIVNNNTLYTCTRRSSMHHSLFLSVMIYFVPFILLIILNVFSTVTLYKNIKNKISRNSTSNNVSREKMFVRFSIANFFSSLFYGGMILFFYFFAIVITTFNRNPIKFFKYYIPYINACLSIVNPTIYIILFKNVRKFYFFCF